MANGVRLGIRSNHEQVFAEIDAEMAAIRTVAIPRALNRLRDQAKVAGLRVVADLYGIGPRTFEKFVSFRNATAGDLESSIVVKGAGLPMYLFGARKIPGGGVSVNIKGHRVVVEKAFIARMKTGHVGVFARGGYGGKAKKFVATGGGFGKFLYSATRLSINELYTFAAPNALASRQATEAMDDRIIEQGPAVLRDAIRFAVRR